MRTRAYRASLARANAAERIAMQVRLMREQAGLTQKELARAIGTQQGAIARLEDAQYGKFSMSALHRVAEYFDVAAWVEFVPFSTLMRRTRDLSPKALTPFSYDREFDKNGQLIEVENSMRVFFTSGQQTEFSSSAGHPVISGVVGQISTVSI